MFNYAQMGRACIMQAEHIEREEVQAMAIERALANLSAILDDVVSLEARSSDGKTGLAWVPDLQVLTAWDKAERYTCCSGRLRLSDSTQ